MSKKSNKNALSHGVYSSDIILPWERAEDFYELLNGIRLDLKPNGAHEDELVFGIAFAHWKKRRAIRALQLEFLESDLASVIEKSGKRSVPGIRRYLKARPTTGSRKERRYAASLSEAMTALADYVNSKKKPSTAKVTANLRSIIGYVEVLQGYLEARTKSQAEVKVSNSSFSLDTIRRANGMEEDLDALIERKFKLLIGAKEYQRQYCQDGNAKLIEHRPLKAKKDVAAKSILTKPTHAVQAKQIQDADDNWQNDNDNNDEEYNWDHEYPEYQKAQAEKKARRKRRAGNN